MTPWNALWASPLLPALLALLLGLRAPALVARDRWDRRDTALLLGAALVGAAAMAWITAPWTMRGFPFTASDFGDYCESLDPIRTGDLARASPHRSVAAGLLPALLAPRLGVVGALAAAALASTAVTCGAIFLAGRALHSRSAGLAAVVFATALPPLAVMPRTVTFYPEMVAGIALTLATALASVRFRTTTFALLAGVGAGVACLADVRGMVFAGPTVAVAILAVLARPRPFGRAALALAAILAPLALSWWIGGRIHPNGWALQDQAVAFAGDALRAVGGDPNILPLATPGERFRWGVDPLDHALPGLRFLARLAGVLSEHAHGSRESLEVARKIAGWPAVLACAALTTLFGLRRRPVLALAAVGALVPPVLVLAQALATNPLPRMFATGLPAVAVIVGVAFAVLLRGALPAATPAPTAATPAPTAATPAPTAATPAPTAATPAQTPTDTTPALRRELEALARPTLALLALAAMVGGVVPTWLGPTRLWRTWNLTDSEPRELLADTVALRERPAGLACQRALLRDRRAGLPLVPTWYGAPPEGWLGTSRTSTPPPAPSATLPPRLPDLDR